MWEIITIYYTAILWKCVFCCCYWYTRPWSILFTFTEKSEMCFSCKRVEHHNTITKRSIWCEGTLIGYITYRHTTEITACISYTFDANRGCTRRLNALDLGVCGFQNYIDGQKGCTRQYVYIFHKNIVRWIERKCVEGYLSICINNNLIAQRTLAGCKQPSLCFKLIIFIITDSHRGLSIFTNLISRE